MQLFLRRALTVTAAGACLAIAGSLTVPVAVAAINEANLAAVAQRYEVTPAWAASVEALETPRDGFTVSEFSLVQWPLAEGTTISSFFGYRSCEGCSSMHSGIDFTPGAGVPIEAIADGTVVGSTVADGSWGTHVTIEHVIDGVVFRSSYAHMQAGSLSLSPGDTVERGQVVGRVGNTGQSFGAHLHFTIQDAAGTFVNPLPWLRSHANIGHGE